LISLSDKGLLNLIDSDSTASTESEAESEEFPKIADLLSQPKATSSRPVRVRKPTRKQESQNRRRREKEDKIKAKRKKVNTTQLEEYELLIRSSQ